MLLTEDARWIVLEKFWDYEANALHPSQFTHGARKRVWWKCLKGHAIEKDIYSALEQGEKLCSSCKNIPYTNPELMDQWDYKKNSVDIYEVGRGYGKVWWKCANAHSFEMTVYNRVSGKGCPFCSNKRIHEKINSLAHLYPELLHLYSAKNKKRPSETLGSLTKSYFWTCVLKHDFSRSISSMLNEPTCPYCSGEKLLEGFNSLIETHSTALKEWSSENTLNPSELLANSSKVAFWECSICSLTYKSKIKRRIYKESGCPACAGQVIKKGLNDLPTFAPELLKDYDYTNNILKPEEVGKGKSVFWICEDGHSFKATPHNRLKGYGFCSICRPNIGSSFGEKELRSYVISLLNKDIELIANDRTLIKPYELDLFIPSLGKAIEFNGDYWHSDEMMKKTRGISANEYHSFKASLVKSKKVELLFVWESDWNSKKLVIKETIKDFLFS